MNASCPDDAVLAEFLDGVAPATTAVSIRAHLDVCASCAEIVAATREADGGDELLRVGRYVVLERIGSGGMGEVHAAYDPELDRKIAIKLHHGGQDGERHLLRLVREARAAASLNHPNVVRVYDAGRVDDGRAFVAMELIHGTTLRTRMDLVRSWRSIVGEMLLAGRGLAAAHAAGLVHRDFKPDNVLVADDGRVLVSDFGLARFEDDIAGTAPAIERDVSVTRTDAIAGTPAYMAPEQLAGAVGDARSDQFAFAVTLYEALYGVRPFAGATAGEIAAAIDGGSVSSPGRAGAAPRWLRRVLVRALARDPDARFSDMAELMRAIDRGLGRRTVIMAAGAVAAFAIVAGLLATARSSEPVCAGAEERVAVVWNSAREQQLRSAFGASGSPIAGSLWERTARAIDAYTAGTTAALMDACEATHVRRSQSAELLDRRSVCLEKGLVDLDELLTALAAADAQSVVRAVEAVSSLPDPAQCGAGAVLASPVGPPDPDATDPVARARRRLARARALHASGRFQDARAILTSPEATADPDYVPLRAERHLVTGQVLRDLGDRTRARAELEKALWAAEEAGDAQIAVDAITLLIPLSGTGAEAEAQATRWANLAEAMVRRSSGSRDSLAKIAIAMGNFWTDRDGYPTAIEKYERAISLLDGKPGLGLAHALNNLGRVHKKAGRLDEARTHTLRALDVFEAEVGPEHPLVATTLVNVGAIHLDAREYDQAIVRLERALDLRRRIFGEQHVDVASVLNNLALAQSHLGDERAIDSYRQAAAILEHHPDHLDRAGVVLSNLSSLLAQRGDFAEATTAARRSLELKLATKGENHLSTGLSRINVSAALQASGKLPEALAEAETALRVVEAAVGKDHTYYALAVGRLGIAQLAVGERAARTTLETALSALSRLDPAAPPEAIAEVELGLARLDRARGRHADATGRAERALRLFTAADQQLGRDEAQRFLTEAKRASREK